MSPSLASLQLLRLSFMLLCLVHARENITSRCSPVDLSSVGVTGLALRVFLSHTRDCRLQLCKSVGLFPQASPLCSHTHTMQTPKVPVACSGQRVP